MQSSEPLCAERILESQISSSDALAHCLGFGICGGTDVGNPSEFSESHKSAGDWESVMVIFLAGKNNLENYY